MNPAFCPEGFSLSFFYKPPDREEGKDDFTNFHFKWQKEVLVSTGR